MKRSDLSQLRWAILSRVDRYNKLKKVDENPYLEEYCDDDSVLEDYYEKRSTPLSLAATVLIYEETNNLFRVEIDLENLIVDQFYYSVNNGSLVFDYDRQPKVPESNVDDLLSIEGLQTDFFDALLKAIEESTNQPSISDPEPLIYSFKISECAFRQYEKDRANKFRRQKLLRIYSIVD
jgi:hypothetical protein